MIEKCTDPLDMANQLQTQANEQAIARQRAAEAQSRKAFEDAIENASFDGEHCTECDDEIPQERLEMFKTQCTPCAQLAEDQKKRRGK